MAINGDGSRSPFEQLKSHYDRKELECPACGYFDEHGEWEARTSGHRVNYWHECPSCGAVQSHTIRTE